MYLSNPTHGEPGSQGRSRTQGFCSPESHCLRAERGAAALTSAKQHGTRGHGAHGTRGHTARTGTGHTAHAAHGRHGTHGTRGTHSTHGHGAHGTQAQGTRHARARGTAGTEHTRRAPTGATAAAASPPAACCHLHLAPRLRPFPPPPGPSLWPVSLKGPGLVRLLDQSVGHGGWHVPSGRGTGCSEWLTAQGGVAAGHPGPPLREPPADPAPPAFTPGKSHAPCGGVGGHYKQGGTLGG